MKCLDANVNREDAILSVPEDRVVRSNFGRTGDLDLSTQEAEFEKFMFPMSQMFDWNEWQKKLITYSMNKGDFDAKWETIRRFHSEVVENFTGYQIPVIALHKSTSKEAVCVVFEKVNTGGMPLDAFELITAMYAAEGHELRKDWYGGEGNSGRLHRLIAANKLGDAESGILANVASTDFLHVVSLFHTRYLRREAASRGMLGKELPQVTGNRQALLNLPLSAYKKYEDKVERGFFTAAKFLHTLHIYRIFDLPYQSQIIPLAAVLADIGEKWEHEANRAKLVKWYWNGVFGELYGSTTETRTARDFTELPIWLDGGAEPSTVSETQFRADRLKTMRMRLSAAYKGVNALLMMSEARDFRSGQKFDYSVFFGEAVDIHHIFPKEWCKTSGIEPSIYDSIINKTPLSYKTNRIIGGVAPSSYLHALENGNETNPPILRSTLDGYLRSHLADPELLRSNDFYAFVDDRQAKLVALIETATGKKVLTGDIRADDEEYEEDEDAAEAMQTTGTP